MKKFEKKNDKNNKIAYMFSELRCIKSFLKPLYEFRDYGNYPAIVRTVKDLQIKLAESEFMREVT